MKTTHDENKIEEVLRNIKLGGSLTANIKEYAEYIREKTIDECIAQLPYWHFIDRVYTEKRLIDIGFYNCREQTITNLNNLKNNEQ